MKIKVSKVLHKYQVTLPKGVREKLDLTIEKINLHGAAS